MNNALIDNDTHALVSQARSELRGRFTSVSLPEEIDYLLHTVQKAWQTDLKLELLGLIYILEELHLRGVKKI